MEDGEKAIKEVLGRRVLLEKLKGEDIEYILQVLQTEAQRNEYFAPKYSYIAQLIRGEFLKIQEAFNGKIAQDIELLFNQAINCGGYALKIDTCIFPGNCDFDTKVSSILDIFPFVRLLGDTKLAEDEYLVLYRAEDRGGHHFIRIEDDGTVVEKEGAQKPQKFSDWGILKDAPEAVLAVKKEHDMNYFDKMKHIGIPTETSKNFEQTIWAAVQNRNNTFEYHGHNYLLKKSDDETIYICSGDEIIAEMLTNGEEYDVEIREEKKGYVSNTQPNKPIRIKDGKYQGDDKEETLR